MAAEPLEREVWQQIVETLRDPDALTQGIKKLRDKHADADEQFDHVALEKRLKAIVRQQERLIAAYASFDGQEGPALDALTTALANADRDYKQVQEELAEIEERSHAATAGLLHLEALAESCTRIAANLDLLSFADRRRLLESLDVRVHVNGSDWTLSGSIPMDGDVGGISCS